MRVKIFKAAFLIGIIAISCIAMPAQKLDNDGLVLFGSVQSQKKSERDGKRIYQIIVRLLFRNDSNQTLIFLSPHIMTRKVEFLYQSLGRGLRPPDESERLVTTIVLPPTVQDSYPADYDWIHSYAAKLDKSESPEQEAIVLQPGASKEFVDVLNIVQLYKLKAGPDGRKIKVWEGFSDGDPECPGIPISDLPAFTVEYRVSLAKHHKDPNFLESLKLRWRGFGNLVLDSDGNFTIKSARIINLSGN